MKRLRLILAVVLFGFAAQSAHAQDVACACDYDELVAQECVATGLCESTAVVVEAADVAVCCDEEAMAVPVHEDSTETPTQEASFIQQYGMWFFVLIIFGLPAIILFIILRAKRRKNR